MSDAPATHAPPADPSAAMAPGKPRNGTRRDEILDVALRLFAQKGMAQVTTRLIAHEVGISQPSLYAHFRSADDIALELSSRAFATLSERMAEFVQAPQSCAERMRHMARAYIRFGLDHPDMYRVAFMIDKPCADDSSAPDPMLDSGLRCFATMAVVVSELIPDDPAEAMRTAQLVWAHLHGLVALLIARAHFPWIDQTDLIEAHIARLPLPPHPAHADLQR